jgi:hypothetical protein
MLFGIGSTPTHFFSYYKLSFYLPHREKDLESGEVALCSHYDDCDEQEGKGGGDRETTLPAAKGRGILNYFCSMLLSILD